MFYSFTNNNATRSHLVQISIKRQYYKKQYYKKEIRNIFNKTFKEGFVKAITLVYKDIKQ